MSTPVAWLRDLAERTGRTLDSLTAMSIGKDPFRYGRAAQVRDAEWFARVWETFGAGIGWHIRRLHYACLSREITLPDGSPYENTDRCEYIVNMASRVARGLKLVDAADFDDRRNAKLTVNTEPPRQAASWLMRASCDLSSGSLVAPELTVMRPWAIGYDYRNADEPYRQAVVIEKSTVDDVLVPLCAHLGVDYLAGKGFQSHTRIRELLHRPDDHRQLRILYGADQDPAGDSMPTAFARYIEFLIWRDKLDIDVAVRHLFLTAEQVSQYELPRKPIKANDLRATAFERKYGRGAVELDALQGNHPGELARIVTAAVEEWRDPHYRPALTSVQREADALVAPAWERHHRRIEMLRSALEQELTEAADSYRARVDEIENSADMLDLRDAIGDVNDDLADVHVPERPTPHVEDAADDWLFRSDRDYLDQLDAYRGRSA